MIDTTWNEDSNRMPKKLSICIVAYNNYDDIKNSILSMEKYTSQKLKKSVYIVDNGVIISKAEDVKEFKKFIKQRDYVIYIDVGENLGFGKGHNKVLEVLDSEYHAIVNPDIIFCEDALSKIIDWMDENTWIGMTIPLIIDEEGHRQNVYRQELTLFDMFNRMFLKGLFKNRAKMHTMQNMDYTKPFQVPFGQGSFLVVRTALFKKIKGFDENYFMYVEDADLCKRVNQVSKLMYYPDAKVIHKWAQGSHKNKKLFKYHIESTKYYFNKWGWKLI